MKNGRKLMANDRHDMDELKETLDIEQNFLESLDIPTPQNGGKFRIIQDDENPICSECLNRKHRCDCE